MENLSKSITGVVITYNTEKLFRKAYESVRKYLPKMPIVIIDGSEKGSDCFRYVADLKNNFLNKVVQTNYNIGHGRGLCVGIYYTETPYILLFDSDIEMIGNPLWEMKKLIKEDTFGVGFIEKTGFDGFCFGRKPNHVKEGFMPYLHPYFMLMQKEVYKQFYPFVHHGAPAIFTMLDIYKRGLSDKILKSFDISSFIKHTFRGTRTVIRNKSKSALEIEGTWEKNWGQV